MIFVVVICIFSEKKQVLLLAKLKNVHLMYPTEEFASLMSCGTAPKILRPNPESKDKLQMGSSSTEDSQSLYQVL